MIKIKLSFDSIESRLGRTAYESGIPSSDNPFVKEKYRVLWQMGWIKAYNLDNRSDKYEE